MEKMYTDKFKFAVQAAEEEAAGMKHNYVGTEHLLLALLKDNDSVAAKVLRAAGLEYGDEVKEAINRVLRGESAYN